MKKLFLLFLLSIFLFSFTSAYTNKVVENGATFLYTNENFSQFRWDLLNNFPECHNGKANGTYLNWTRTFDMNCHIFINTTEEVYWEGFTMNFDGYSNQINKTHAMIIYINNSLINFNKNLISFNGNSNSTDTLNLFGMPEHLQIGTCNRNAVANNLKSNYDTPTKEIIKNSGFAYHTYYSNSSFISITGEKATVKSFLCNGQLNNTLWINSQPSGLSQSNGSDFYSTNSYLDSPDTMISYLDASAYIGSFTSIGGNNLCYDHKATSYCFIPTLGNVNVTFRNAKLKCGTQFAFGFLAYVRANLIDSESDTYSSGGYFADVQIDNYFSVKNDIINKEGNPVYVDYSLIDNAGTTYLGSGNSLDEEILIERYTTSSYQTFMPLNVTITNSSYLSLTNYSWNLSTNNKGLYSFQQIPYALELNPNSDYNMIVG